MNRLIYRHDLMRKLLDSKDKESIKVVTGIRRSGKSTLLQMFADELSLPATGPKPVQHYNFEDPRTNMFNDWRQLYDHITSKLALDTMNYVFLDEIQELPEFEKLLDGLFVHRLVDLYVTGSNANFLSSDLATLLSGRYIDIHVTPFSLSEFSEVRSALSLSAQEARAPSNSELLRSYLYGSGFPVLAFEKDIDGDYANNYLENLYRTILTKDVYQRYRLRSRRSFESVCKFIYANIGSITSPSNIADSLTKAGYPTTNKTVERYLGILQDCFLVYKLERFDIRGKKQLRSQEKYYVPDLGLRRITIGRAPGSDIGHLVENIVFFELLRRGGKVWLGKAGRHEVDFVVQKPRGYLEYYQVAYTAKEESTLQRELRPLRNIQDNYAKYLITTDEFELDYDGIQTRNLSSWLLE